MEPCVAGVVVGGGWLDVLLGGGLVEEGGLGVELGGVCLLGLLEGGLSFVPG